MGCFGVAVRSSRATCEPQNRNRIHVIACQNVSRYRAAGRVALGSYPPRAPTDPDVRTLAHPVPRPTASPSAVVPEAIRSSYGDMWFEPRCARHVSLNRVCRPTLRFPPQGPPGRVPLPQQYYQSATTSCRPSRRASLPSLGGTSVFHSLCSLLGGRVCRRGLELVTRYLRPGFQRGNDRTSQVPGEPQLSVCTCSNPTPAGLLAPDRSQCSSVAPG